LLGHLAHTGRSKEISVPDNKSNSGGQDRKLISLTEDYEVRDWSKKFGVTPDELRKAVEAVGNEAANVESYLKRKS
jgi:hypothetical protein